HLWSRRVVTSSRGVKKPPVLTGGCVTVKNLKFRANFDEKLENMKFTSNLLTLPSFLLIH
ncbi:hypothetical protein ABQE30_20395, partial [Enterococcus avium]|uniref:hypothetical protein n=1 Tax=Enterococcus avium TaxID=33945 RepID=UPI0032E37408